MQFTVDGVLFHVDFVVAAALSLIGCRSLHRQLRLRIVCDYESMPLNRGAISDSVLDTSDVRLAGSEDEIVDDVGGGEVVLDFDAQTHENCAECAAATAAGEAAAEAVTAASKSQMKDENVELDGTDSFSLDEKESKSFEDVDEASVAAAQSVWNVGIPLTTIRIHNSF